MLRYGTPYDNALTENFFSMLKTECIFHAKIHAYEKAHLLTGTYIYFYNNEHIQLKRTHTT